MVTQQVQSTSQGNPQPTTGRTSIPLVYYLQQRCKTEAQENPLPLDNPMLLLQEEVKIYSFTHFPSLSSNSLNQHKEERRRAVVDKFTLPLLHLGKDSYCCLQTLWTHPSSASGKAKSRPGIPTTGQSQQLEQGAPPSPPTMCATAQVHWSSVASTLKLRLGSLAYTLLLQSKQRLYGSLTIFLLFYTE